MTTPASPPVAATPSLDFVSLGGNFLLVLALLIAVLWLLRRLQGVRGFQGLKPLARRLTVVEALSVGPRQKIVLLRVDEREVLVGISPTGFTLLQAAATPADGLTPRGTPEGSSAGHPAISGQGSSASSPSPRPPAPWEAA